jgi:uncharacterized metal-binding protein
MPSGHTHDRLAWWTSALLALGLGSLGRWDLAIWAGCGSLFGGLMFSGDLDTISRPLRRWGLLRGLWWPYRKLVPHRGTHSHGLIWGPLFRSVYLFVLVVALVALAQAGLRAVGWQETAGTMRLATGRLMGQVATLPLLGLAAFAGGILFANAVHSVSDWTASGAKRLVRKPRRRGRR